MNENKKPTRVTTIEQLLAAEPREPKTALVSFPGHVLPDSSPLTVQIRELGYNKVAEIKRATTDTELHVVLAGVVAPDLKDAGLQEHLGAPTPFDAIRKLFSAGEIAELAMEIERLSGYRRRVSELIEDVEKN